MFALWRRNQSVVFAGVAVLLAALGSPVLSAQEGPRAARLRETAARFLGGTVDAVGDLLPGESLDDALIDPLGGGGHDLEQSLGGAVFAVPVAGSVGYVLRGQLYHDLSIVFPPDWRIVDVMIADDTRWRYARRGSLVVVQPGQIGARTNMTVIFQSGEFLQLDLEEVTGLFGRIRTGRAYIGYESWLVERVFAMMPRQVRDRVVALMESGTVRVSELLADPVAVIRSHGGFDALPPESDDRWDRLREMAQQRGLPREVPSPSGSLDSVSDQSAPELDVDDPPAPASTSTPSSLPPVRPRVPLFPGTRPDAGEPAPEASVEPDVSVPAAEPGVLRIPRREGADPLPLSPLLEPPAESFDGGGSRDVIVPEAVPFPDPAAPSDGGVGPLPRPFSGHQLGGAARAPPTWVHGDARVIQASLSGSDRVSGVESRQGVVSGSPLVRRELRQAPLYVSADELQQLEEQLAQANASLASSRRAAGDRIASATVAIDHGIEDLRRNYPSSIHFSLLMDPDVPPYTAPFHHLGGWHDGEYTYWRILAVNPTFVDMRTGRPVEAVRLDDYLYRLPRVLEHGAVVVTPDGRRPRHLYWRRRRELEGP